MAHGRQGPDIVMTIQPAAASDIRAMTQHELYRTPDGSSAIDPLRSHLNEILLGPRTQQEAVKKLYDDGVAKPALQAEAPFVQMVLSASSIFFRQSDQGPGEWDQEALDTWVTSTMRWLRKEYEEDLIHVALHLDEDVPHMHVLIAPTYPKSPRMPGKQCKGESDAEFTARKEKALTAEPIRTVGRASNKYWKRNYVKLLARQSYHAAMEKLGLGYGRDFVGKDEPSPWRKETGVWVREQAAFLKDEHAKLESDRAALDAERAALDSEWAAVDALRAKIGLEKSALQRDHERLAAERNRQKELAEADKARIAADAAEIEVKRQALRLEKTEQMCSINAERNKLDSDKSALAVEKKEFAKAISGLKETALALGQREEFVIQKEELLDRLLSTARGVFDKLLPSLNVLSASVGLRVPQIETVRDLANVVNGLEEEAIALLHLNANIPEQGRGEDGQTVSM